MKKTAYGEYIITDEQFAKLNFRLANIKRSKISQRAFINDNGSRIQINVCREVSQGCRDTRTLNFIVVSVNKPDGFLRLDFNDADEEKELKALGYNSILDVNLSDFNERFDPRGE